MRGRVIRALKDLNAIPVENPALPGTPDVNYVEGWIELKWLPEWPVRADTIVRVETYTPQQRAWHIRRRLAGGKTWMLIHAGPDWVLLDGATAAMQLGQCTRAELLQLAIAHTERRSPTPEELVRWISQTQNAFIFGDAERDCLRKLLQSTSVPRLTDI